MVLMFPDLQPVFEALEQFFKDFRKMMTPPKIHHSQLPKKSSWTIPTHHDMFKMPTQTHHKGTTFGDLFKIKMPTHQAKKTVEPTHKQPTHKQYKDPMAEMFKGMFR